MTESKECVITSLGKQDAKEYVFEQVTSLSKMRAGFINGQEVEEVDLLLVIDTKDKSCVVIQRF